MKVVPRTAPPLHFFRQFYCRTYPSATTHRKQKNRIAEIFASGIAWAALLYVTMAIPDAAFSAFRFCSYAVGLYVVCCTIGLFSDSLTFFVSNFFFFFIGELQGGALQY